MIIGSVEICIKAHMMRLNTSCWPANYILLYLRINLCVTTKHQTLETVHKLGRLNFFEIIQIDLKQWFTRGKKPPRTLDRMEFRVMLLIRGRIGEYSNRRQIADAHNS